MSSLNSLSSRRLAVGNHTPVGSEPLTGSRQTPPEPKPRFTVPFPRDQPRAAATASIGKPLDDPHSVERDMLDELLGPSSARSASSRPGRASTGTLHDMELMTAMADRLGKAEAAARVLREALVEKDKEIMSLKRELDAANVASSGGRAATEILQLRGENDRLKAQVHEMETFLNDYGLVWVGNSTPSLPAPSAATESPLPSDTPVGFTVKYALLEQKVKALNSIAGDGKAKIQQVGGAHRLVLPDGVPFTVFRNGFMLRRGPFRPYSDAANQAFINDIMDGYFPSEFKTSCPDGVILEIRDRSTEEYGSESYQAFVGRGRTVGDGNKPKTLADMGDPEMPLTAQEFLNALPKSVIKNGSVIDVRSGVAGMLKGPSGASDDTPGVVVAQTEVVAAMQGSAATPEDVTTLRVKSDGGKQTIILKMRYDQTVGDVRKYIDDHRVSEGLYELRTAIPNRAYDDAAQSLRDAGLIPNATLMIRPISV